MSLRFSALSAFLLCSLLTGLTACKQPIAAALHANDSPASGKPAFGSYNIHKRHGLGGWDRSTGPSEKALLQQMETNTQPVLPSQTSSERNAH